MRISTLCIAVAVTLFGSLPSPAAPATSSAHQSLHRVDFRIEGASCVVCLRRIAKTLRETKGILKADVSIYRPYWAIAIYDAKTANFDQLKGDISKKEKVRFMDIEDKTIAEVPAVVIPKMGGLPTDKHIDPHEYAHEHEAPTAAH